jgi:nitroreductase
MHPSAESLLHYATLAPSGHNTQPWKFSVEHETVRICPDLSRRLPVVDPDDHALYISLGCALENLLIAAAHHGLDAHVDYFPVDEAEACLRTRLRPAAAGAAGEWSLFHAIPERQSNRRNYDGRTIPAPDVSSLLSAGPCESVSVRAFGTGEPGIEPLIGFVEEGNIAQFNDRAFVAELVSWIRFSAKEVRARRDGLTAAALGFPAVPRWLGRWIMTTLARPHGEAARQAKAIRSSSLLLLFIARDNARERWVDVGRSFQRTALMATALGIAHAHVNMPCEVEPIRRRLAAHLQLGPEAQPLLLIRLGYAKPLPPAPRRPLEQVMTRRGPAAAA